MKILIIHNKYQTKNIGGEDIVFFNELNALTERLGDDNIFSYDTSNDNLSKIKLLFNIWFSLKHYKAVFDLVKANNIDIVHVHNFFPMLTPSVFKAAKDAGAKVIHTLHNYRWWCISGIFYRKGYGICEACLENKLTSIVHKCYRGSVIQSIFAQMSFLFYKYYKPFHLIDSYFVLTSFQREKLIHIGLDATKIIIKPNFIVDYPLDNDIKSGYIFVGRLEESKGIEILINVWKELGNEYKLTVVGTGELEVKLMSQKLSSNISFLGKKSHEETLRLISRSKYLIQPSLWYETFGLTIIEAMSLGIPVIGFEIGTRPDFIIHNVNGFLCEPQTLKSTIIMSENISNYNFLSKNAIIDSKQYSEDIIINKQIEIYGKIVNSY